MAECLRPVPVWSKVQRVIHWVNAFSVLLLIPLGLFLFFGEYLDLTDEAEDTIMDIHGTIGIILVIGVVARWIYLFTGPPSSRWKDVLPHTRAQFSLGLATIKYYLSGFKGKAPLYLSHNPLAGLFDTVLFVTFLFQGTSGLVMFLFHPEGHGHGTGMVDHTPGMAGESFPPDWLMDLHAMGAFIIIAFVLAHFSALGAHDSLERRGLVSSMISGEKFFTDEEIKELEPELKDKTPRPE